MQILTSLITSLVLCKIMQHMATSIRCCYSSSSSF